MISPKRESGLTLEVFRPTTIGRRGSYYRLFIIRTITVDDLLTNLQSWLLNYLIRSHF